MTFDIKTVTEQTIGFSFHVTIERESRTETGAKYPDKTVVKASLGGHADTLDEAKARLKDAVKMVREQLKEMKV